MKLHLTKSLRTALLACVCAATASTSWGLTLDGDNSVDFGVDTTYAGVFGDSTDGTGNLTLTGNGSAVKNTSASQSINHTGNLTFSVDKSIEIGGWDGSFYPSTIGENVKDVAVEKGTVVLTCHSVLNNSGSLSVASGASLQLVNDTIININGAIGGTGTLILGKDSGVTLNMDQADFDKLTATKDTYTNGNFAVTSAMYDLFDGTVELNGTSVVQVGTDSYTLGDGATFTVESCVVSDDHTLTAADSAAVTGAISVAAGKTLTINAGSGSLSKNVKLGDGSTLYLNAESVNADVAVTIDGDATIKGHSTSMRADVTGTGDLTLEKDTEATEEVYLVKGLINNTGKVTIKGVISLEKDSDTEAGTIGSNVTDVTIETGKTTFVSGTTLDNNGTITIVDGATLQINNGSTVNLNGKIQGTGTLILGESADSSLVLNMDAAGLKNINVSATADITYTDNGNGFISSKTDVYDLFDGDSTINGTASIMVGENTYALYDDAKFDVTVTETDYSTYYVNTDGDTLTVNEMNQVGDKISVAAGKTLTLAESMNLGKGNDGKRTIELNDGATLAGEGLDLGLQNGYIKANGADNVISANLKQVWDVNVEVGTAGALTLKGALKASNDTAKLHKTGEGALTIAGAIDSGYTINHDSGTIDISNGVENVITLNMNGADFSVSGKGTSVVLNSDSSVQSGTITVGNGATLDLSKVLTLGTSSLVLEGGSTIKVGQYFGEGGSPITLGDVAITGNITIDLSDWCAVAEFQDWETLFQKHADAEGLFSTTYYGVTVLYEGGEAYVGSYLTPSQDGTGLQLVPEPTTATLSLLALAGLAARRRRK